MKIYIDIILFENLCMNYIILFATGIVLKRRINNLKLIISSFIGSVYAIIIYLKILDISSNIIMKILLSISMVWIAFKEKNYKIFLKDLLMFYLVSFIFGGCSFALIYFISPNKVQIRNGVLVGLYPIKVTLIAGVISFVIIQIAFKITKNKLSTDDMICKIHIYFGNKSIIIKALVDSGNMLKDPISGYPVIIVEKNVISKILSGNFLKLINEFEGGELKNYELEDYKSKIRMIPFMSLGKENGMLVGIKIDKIIVNYKEKEEIINEVIAGIYNKKLTKDNKYNALIGLKLLEEDNENKGKVLISSN